MNLEEHKKEFEKIVKKYKLFKKEKAEEIANFLTKSKKNNTISPKEFQTLFAINTEEEAKIFLTFIDKGLTFKKEHIDKNKK